jgi:hypothetical protein
MAALTLAAVGGKVTAALLNQFRTALLERIVMTRVATQSIANGTATPVTIDFDTSIVTSGCFTESAGIFTCVTAGRYKVQARIQFAANATGTRILQIKKNGTVITTNENGTVPATFPGTVVDWYVDSFSVGDTTEITVMQNSGAALNVTYGQVAIELMAA